MQSLGSGSVVTVCIYERERKRERGREQRCKVIGRDEKERKTVGCEAALGEKVEQAQITASASIRASPSFSAIRAVAIFKIVH